MNGLVYSLDDDADSTPVYWMGIAIAAVALHALALFCLTIKEPTLAPIDDVVTVSLDDSFLNLPPEPAPNKPEVPPAPAMKEVAAAQPKPVPAPPVAEPVATPAAVVEPPPAIPEKPKAAAAPTPPPAVPTPPPAKTADAQPVPRPLNEKALPSMIPQADTAFDENTHVTKNAPDKAYLSDRTSTAADRGPKNLPQGDPYIDKGESNRIKYMGKRGEGNVPPLDSDAASGSVKVEGAKVAGDSGGKQAADFSKSVATAEIKVPTPVEPIAKETSQPDKPDKAILQDKPAEKIAEKLKVAEETPLPPPARIVKPDLRPIAKPKPPEPDPIPSETGTLVPPPKRPKEVAAEPVQLPTNFDLNERKRPTPAPRPQTENRAENRPASRPAVVDPVTQQGNLAEKALDQQAELDRFEAALNGVNSVGSGNGTPGTGANLRKGEQGHEGNGAMRPGDDNAVSDVTTVNLESSASELGDPRFAKRFDPKTAYIKRFARRIDGKWKADIAAHLRSSLIPGSVSIRIVLRKDGKLIEASEVHRDRGVRDDYVATAKRAVEEAANPNADPFPNELSDRDSIEYTFTFLYN